MTRHARDAGIETPRTDVPEEEIEIGVPDAQITTAVDIGTFVPIKRAAMMAHASQIPDDSWFLTLPPEAFREAFGSEWFVRTTPPFDGSIPADRESWLLG